MRTELEPYLGQYIYFQATVSTWKDGVHRSGPTSDQTTTDVKDVCLQNVKWSWLDLDATGQENNDAFFASNNRTDHLWPRMHPSWMGNMTRLDSTAMVGWVYRYTRKDGSQDIGVMGVTMLLSGNARETITKHLHHKAYGLAYEVCIDMIQTAKDGVGVLVAPNASHNKILEDFIRFRDKLKLRMRKEQKSLKPKRKPKLKLAKGFA